MVWKMFVRYLLENDYNSDLKAKSQTFLTSLYLKTTTNPQKYLIQVAGQLSKIVKNRPRTVKFSNFIYFCSFTWSSNWTGSFKRRFFNWPCKAAICSWISWFKRTDVGSIAADSIYDWVELPNFTSKTLKGVSLVIRPYTSKSQKNNQFYELRVFQK